MSELLTRPALRLISRTSTYSSFNNFKLPYAIGSAGSSSITALQSRFETLETSPELHASSQLSSAAMVLGSTKEDGDDSITVKARRLI